MITILLILTNIVTGFYLYFISCEKKELKAEVNRYIKTVENLTNSMMKKNEEIKFLQNTKKYYDDMLIDLKEQNVVLQKKYTELTSAPKKGSKKKKN